MLWSRDCVVSSQCIIFFGLQSWAMMELGKWAQSKSIDCSSWFCNLFIRELSGQGVTGQKLEVIRGPGSATNNFFSLAEFHSEGCSCCPYEWAVTVRGFCRELGRMAASLFIISELYFPRNRQWNASEPTRVLVFKTWVLIEFRCWYFYYCRRTDFWVVLDLTNPGKAIPIKTCKFPSVKLHELDAALQVHGNTVSINFHFPYEKRWLNSCLWMLKSNSPELQPREGNFSLMMKTSIFQPCLTLFLSWNDKKLCCRCEAWDHLQDSQICRL